MANVAALESALNEADLEAQGGDLAGDAEERVEKRNEDVAAAIDTFVGEVADETIDAVQLRIDKAVREAIALLQVGISSAQETADAAAAAAAAAGGGGTVLVEWNQADVSEFTQVMGNGIGGVGSAGEWSISASTFPDTEVPAIRVDMLGASASPALWLFDGATPEDWGTEFMIDWWATINGGGGDAVELGLVFYYEDNDHWLSANQYLIDDIAIEGNNGASGTLLSMVLDDRFVLTSINEDNGTGDRIPITIWLRRATASVLPAATVMTPIEYRVAGVHGAVFPPSVADSDWLSLGTYAHKIGIYARNRVGTGPGHDFTRFRFKPY